MSLFSTIARIARGPAERRGADPKCADCGCPEGLPADDPAFASAVTALGAKLARAGATEAAAGRSYTAFTEAFPPQPRADGQVRRLFSLARQTTAGFEGYARQLGARYRACPKVLERVIEGLFHVAKADGVVSAPEMAYLERVSALFGLSPLSFRRLRNAQVGAAADDPYTLLHVEPDAPDEAVRAAWKLAIVRIHPDRAVAAGVPVAEAESDARNLNAAFDAVMRERRSIFAKRAA